MNKRRETKTFDFFCYEEIGKYLSEKHREGWKFVNAAGIKTFTFEECEPEDVTYQLDFNEHSVTDKKDEYFDIFDACGWEYVEACGDYNVFRKKTELIDGEEPFHTDYSAHIARMDKLMRNMLLQLLLIPIVFIPNGIRFASEGEYIWVAIIVVITIVYSITCFKSWKNYKRAKRKNSSYIKM